MKPDKRRNKKCRKARKSSSNFRHLRTNNAHSLSHHLLRFHRPILQDLERDLRRQAFQLFQSSSESCGSVRLRIRKGWSGAFSRVNMIRLLCYSLIQLYIKLCALSSETEKWRGRNACTSRPPGVSFLFDSFLRLSFGKYQDSAKFYALCLDIFR